MNRRQFLSRLLLGGAACAAVPLLAKVPLSIPHKWNLAEDMVDRTPKPKKFYPLYKGKELIPLHPDNIQIRADSDELVASFTTQAEYNALFAWASNLHRNLNDAEAGYLARAAARKLHKGLNVPKEVIGLSCMLAAYGIRYTERGNEATKYDLPCRKHTSPK